jgi:ATP-binding protein involved in chromosome partitioning
MTESQACPASLVDMPDAGSISPRDRIRDPSSAATTDGQADIVQAITAQLATVNDPEIRRPITELDMVTDVVVRSGVASIGIALTVAGCPMRDRLTADVTAAALRVPGVSDARVSFSVMTDEQREVLKTKLRNGVAPKSNPFSATDSLTKVYAIASGKGGVGKSSVTANLAVALAGKGVKVGVIDADVYGHSLPAMFGVADAHPTRVDDMIMPITAYGVRLISVGMLKPRREQVIAWRGPMLDKALTQMLTDVYWGDLDVLLLDLPPGTGDVAISVGQQLGGSDVLVVTTPQDSAAEVAERAGTMASMLDQKVIGVVENMSYLVCPHCGDTHHIDVFGRGGGIRVAETLTSRLGYDIPLLAEIPLDPHLGVAADQGRPMVVADPDAPAARALASVADLLASRRRGLAGKRLGLSTV